MNAISINPNVLHEDDLATIGEVYSATSDDKARKSFSARFRDLSLFGKLRSVFGVFLALTLVLSMVAAAGLYSVYGQYKQFANVNAGAVASADLVGHTGEMRYHSLRYIFAGEDAAVERLLESQGEAAKDLDAIEARITGRGADYAANVAELRSQQDLYRNTFDRLRYNLKTDGRNAETTAIAYELSTAGDTLFQQARSLETRLLSEATQIESDGLAKFNRFVIFGALLVAATLLTTVLGLRFLSGDLTAKLREIVNAMNRLSKGDADFELEGKERADEIGEMVRAIQVFQIANHRLIKYSAERAERAQAELEERERSREEQQRLLVGLADQFEKTVGDVVSGVAAASSQLQTTATNMAGTAEEATRQTAEVSNSMEEANRGATAAASASDEFAMSIGEISRQAASSAELARRATTSANEADETISALSDSAVQVGQIVELIQTIAQRTNLLALNASIEAARGGEAGRGFAVVASEVKELAMQTSRATEQIAEQIRAMQDTTGASVSALRSIAEQVQQLETTAVSIASAVDQQSVAGQDLARSIDLAARSTDRVSSHIAEVRELSLSTGAAASQVLSSATDLEEQASTLRGQVQGFLAKIRSA